MPARRRVVLGLVLMYAWTLTAALVMNGYLCDIFEEHRLGITIISNQTVRSPIGCLMSCIHDTQCYSVDVCVLDPEGMMLCQTNRGMVRDVTSLRQDVSCTHYRVKELDPRFEACMSGACYFFSSHTLPNWHAAMNDCSLRHGNLLMLKSRDESDLVKAVLNGRYATYTSKFYGIGGYRYLPDSDFKWLDRTPLEETLNDWNIEDDRPKEQLRLAYKRYLDNFNWFDVDRYVRLDYICKLPYDKNGYFMSYIISQE